MRNVDFWKLTKPLMNEKAQYRFQRTAEREISIIIGGIVIPIATDLNWHVGNVISDKVFDLSGPQFAVLREARERHKLSVNGFTKICHGYSNDPGRFPCERISYEEFTELYQLSLLTVAEVAEYHRYLARLDNAPEKDSTENAGPTKIYLIRDNTTQYIKIGQSHRPERRLKTLVDQATLMPTPNDFVLIHWWDAAGIVEKQLHKQFAPKHIRGEWFRLTDEDVAEIIKVTKKRD